MLPKLPNNNKKKLEGGGRGDEVHNCPKSTASIAYLLHIPTYRFHTTCKKIETHTNQVKACDVQYTIRQNTKSTLSSTNPLGSKHPEEFV